MTVKRIAIGIVALGFLAAPMTACSPGDEDESSGVHGNTGKPGKADNSNLVLDEQANGKILIAAVNTEFTVALNDFYKSIPYQKDRLWFFGSATGVQLLGQQPSSGNMGQARKTGDGYLVPNIFTFKVLSASEGSLSINLKYWYGSSPIIKTLKIIVNGAIKVNTTKLYSAKDPTKSQKTIRANPGETLTFGVENLINGAGVIAQTSPFSVYQLFIVSSSTGVAPGTFSGCPTKIGDPTRVEPVKFDTTNGTGEFDLGVPAANAPNALYVQAVLSRANATGTCDLVASSDVLEVVVNKPMRVDAIAPASVVGYAGGQTITISGENLYQVTKATINGKDAGIQSKSANELIVVAPSFAEKINLTNCFGDPKPFRETSFAASLVVLGGGGNQAAFAGPTYEMSESDKQARESSIQTAYSKAHAAAAPRTTTLYTEITCDRIFDQLVPYPQAYGEMKSVTIKNNDTLIFDLNFGRGDSHWSSAGEVSYAMQYFTLYAPTDYNTSSMCPYREFVFDAKGATGNTTIMVYRDWDGGYTKIHHFIVDVKIVAAPAYPQYHCGV